MKTSQIITFCYLRSQRIELLCPRWTRGLCRLQLPLADSVHDFHASERTAGRPNGLEPEHGPREPFHCSVVLLHDVIQIFGVPDNNGRLVQSVAALNGGGVA